jgi:hypothetical protein
MLIDKVFPGSKLRALSPKVRERVAEARFHGLEGGFVML